MFRIWSYQPVNLPSTKLPPPECWPSQAYRRTHFGQHVLWHEYHSCSDNSNAADIDSTGGGRHVSAQVLEAYRQQGDEVVDEILELYAQEGRPLLAGDDPLDRAASSPSQATTTASTGTPNSSKADQALQKLVQYHSKIPSWVDLPQLERGRQVFLAYLPAIGMSLYYRSLVPGFSIPKIAAVLQSTAYLAPPASRQAVQDRLQDTGAFLAAILGEEELTSILPEGGGWKAALRVRFLHAKVRRQLRTRRRKQQKNRRTWDTHHLGIPINAEDMAATLLAFSTNSLLGCEMILGRPLPQQDRLDYLALWRYLGWLLGVTVDDDNHNTATPCMNGDATGSMNAARQPPEQVVTSTTTTTTTTTTTRALDPCGPGWYEDRPNPLEHSYAIFQSIILHIMQPDESSIRIAHHLLRMGTKKDNGKESKDVQEEERKRDLNWYYFRSFQCRRFVGDELADALQLALRPTLVGRLYQWCISTLYLSILSVYTVAGLPWSPFRRRLVRFHRNNMNKFLDHWHETHVERMKSRLFNKLSSNSSKTDSACPFAMILLEEDGDDSQEQPL